MENDFVDDSTLPYTRIRLEKKLLLTHSVPYWVLDGKIARVIARPCWHDVVQ